MGGISGIEAGAEREWKGVKSLTQWPWRLEVRGGLSEKTTSK